MDRRDKVIDHVSEMYGRETISRIITFGGMAAKAVVRDMGRVLGHAYGFVDTHLQVDPAGSGHDARQGVRGRTQAAELVQQDEEVKDLIDMTAGWKGWCARRRVNTPVAW
ncbi:hypothetical protein ACNKHX_01145 [Shigella flexneri]